MMVSWHWMLFIIHMHDEHFRYHGGCEKNPIVKLHNFVKTKIDGGFLYIVDDTTPLRLLKATY